MDPAAAKVRDLNFKYLAEGKGATVTVRFGPDGITICDPNRVGDGAAAAAGAIDPRVLFPIRRGRRGLASGRAIG